MSPLGPTRFSTRRLRVEDSSLTSRHPELAGSLYMSIVAVRVEAGAPVGAGVLEPPPQARLKASTARERNRERFRIRMGFLT
jgi:hypothetical protein